MTTKGMTIMVNSLKSLALSAVSIGIAIGIIHFVYLQMLHLLG